MTRDEFMEMARREIDQAFAGQKKRMMNLVQKAWAEGKRAADGDGMRGRRQGAVGGDERCGRLTRTR